MFLPFPRKRTLRQHARRSAVDRWSSAAACRHLWSDNRCGPCSRSIHAGRGTRRSVDRPSMVVEGRVPAGRRRHRERNPYADPHARPPRVALRRRHPRLRGSSSSGAKCAWCVMRPTASRARVDAARTPTLPVNCDDLRVVGIRRQNRMHDLPSMRRNGALRFRRARSS
jgi:hypothetical protein